MAKINLTEDILKHDEEEIVEYLYGLLSAIYREYASADDPTRLLKVSGQVAMAYSTLKAMNDRNKEKAV